MIRVLLGILLLSGSTAVAQLHTVGFHGGGIYSSLGSNFNNGENQGKLDFIGGLNYQYRFTNAFTLGGNLEFTQYGAQVPVDYYDVFGEYIATANSSWDWNYVSVPIIVGYEMGGKFRIKPKMALVPSILTRSIYNFQPYEGSTLSPIKTSYYTDAKKIDLAGMAGVDLSARFHSGYVFTAIDFRYSLTTVNNDNFFSTATNDSYRHRGLTFSLGVRFNIGNPEPEGPKDIIDNPID